MEGLCYVGAVPDTASVYERGRDGIAALCSTSEEHLKQTRVALTTTTLLIDRFQKAEEKI